MGWFSIFVAFTLKNSISFFSFQITQIWRVYFSKKIGGLHLPGWMPLVAPGGAWSKKGVGSHIPFA